MWNLRLDETDLEEVKTAKGGINSIDERKYGKRPSSKNGSIPTKVPDVPQDFVISHSLSGRELTLYATTTLDTILAEPFFCLHYNIGRKETHSDLIKQSTFRLIRRNKRELYPPDRYFYTAGGV